MEAPEGEDIYRRLSLRLLQGAVLCASLCIFLYSTQVLFPFVTPKAWFFSLIVELSLPLAVLVWCWYPERRLSGRRFLPLILFLGVMAVAAIRAGDPMRAWFSTAERMLGMAGWIHAALWGGYAAMAFRSSRERQVLCGAFLVIAVALSLAGMWEWQFGGFLSTELHRRIWATTGNANILAAYLACTPFFALPLLPLARRRPVMGGLFAGAFVCIFTALFLTDGRAGMLGLGAGGIVSVVVLAYVMRRRTYGRYLLGGVGAAAVLALVGVGLLFGVSSRGEQLAARFWESGMYDRTLLFQAAAQGIKEHPLLGVGPEQFSFLFNQQYRSVEYVFLQDARWSDQSHNIILDVLLSAGLLGVIAFLAMLVVAGWSLLRALRGEDVWQAAAWAGSLTAYLVTHLLTPQTFGPHLFFFLFVSCALQMGELRTVQKKPLPSQWVWGAAGLAGGVGIVAAFFLVVIPAQANVAVIRATHLLYTGQIQSSIALYDVAFRQTALYRPELRFYAAKEVAQVVDAIHPPDARVAYAWSLRQWEQNMRDRPLDVIDRLSFAQLALTLGEADPEFWQRGWDTLLPALERSPGRPQIRYTLARIALARQEPEVAAAVLRVPIFAIDREPEWWWLQARIANMRDDVAEARHFLPIVKSLYRFLGAAELAEVRQMVGDTDPAFIQKVNEARPDGE